MTKQQYYGTKLVTAWPSVHPHSLEPGYAVQYADDYVSWSPKAVFEAAYQPTHALSYGHALVAIQAGKKVRRSWWSSEAFIYFVPRNLYPASGNTLNTLQGIYHDDMVPYDAYIAFRTANLVVTPYTAPHADQLANDWMIVDL